MAADNFNKVKIDDNDCVIISASPIPGNEKMVYKVINNLYKLGADVIYSKLHEVHASGHACQEELKIIHSLLAPKYFIPVHGEYRHLKMHKDLAVSLGLPQRNCIASKIDDKTYNRSTFCSGTQKLKNMSPNAKKATMGILKIKAKIFIDFSNRI